MFGEENNGRCRRTDHPPGEALVGRQVVVDMRSPWVYIGTLVDWGSEHLLLHDVDAHDLRDSPTTREKYVLDTRLHGVRVNRRRVWIRAEEVVSVSALDDVLVD